MEQGVNIKIKRAFKGNPALMPAYSLMAARISVPPIKENQKQMSMMRTNTLSMFFTPYDGIDDAGHYQDEEEWGSEIPEKHDRPEIQG